MSDTTFTITLTNTTKEDAFAAIDGPRLRAELELFVEGELRGWLKHGHTFKSVDEALEIVRGNLFEMLRGV